MLSKISQFQNMTKIYHKEHKSQRYFHRDIFFFSTVAARMLRISPLIVIYKRPVYLFLTRRWSNSTLVLLSSTVLRFCGASKEVKWKKLYQSRAGTCFILHVQRAGVVIKTNFNIKKKKKLIAFTLVLATKESLASPWINDSRQLFSQYFWGSVKKYFFGINSKRIKFKLLDRSYLFSASRSVIFRT